MFLLCMICSYSFWFYLKQTYLTKKLLFFMIDFETSIALSYSKITRSLKTKCYEYVPGRAIL